MSNVARAIAARSSSRSITARFAEFARAKGLTNKTKDADERKRYREERKEFFGKAVNEGFERNFGKNEVSLEAWLGLCKTVGLKDVKGLTDVEACKKALKDRYVNIVDLVDAAEARKTCTTFTSAAKLRTYTRGEKIYPLRAAERNPLLETFLIRLTPEPPKSQPAKKTASSRRKP
ncbi:uncharacterized protein SCHCODRAFT_02641046 [Schizophyllum commune H4-8]|nr:uncharacterized protein SCHCODRAFT_02641046 [Schizophyllum commune H4-8]KAI5887228.1 hypothetical protein SCHCODRAFT_02641046 [Schizophyllum commune H4-8]